MIDPFVPVILYNRDPRPFSMDELELHERTPRVLPLIPAASKGAAVHVGQPGPHPAKAYHMTMWELDARAAAERART